MKFLVLSKNYWSHLPAWTGQKHCCRNIFILESSCIRQHVSWMKKFARLRQIYRGLTSMSSLLMLINWRIGITIWTLLRCKGISIGLVLIIYVLMKTPLITFYKFLCKCYLMISKYPFYVHQVVKLYERCLIPCANYPEFWMRYVEFMETKGGREIANYALNRATQIFLKVCFLTNILFLLVRHQLF